MTLSSLGLLIWNFLMSSTLMMSIDSKQVNCLANFILYLKTFNFLILFELDIKQNQINWLILRSVQGPPEKMAKWSWHCNAYFSVAYVFKLFLVGIHMLPNLFHHFILLFKIRSVRCHWDVLIPTATPGRWVCLPKLYLLEIKPNDSKIILRIL